MAEEETGKGIFSTHIWRVEKMRRIERGREVLGIFYLVKEVGGSRPERSFPCLSWAVRGDRQTGNHRKK
jgi:hypothetical protein